jgi:hypothetical protein
MMKAAAMPYQRPLRKRAQTQELHVKVMNQFRITSEQDLEPAIQAKAVYLVGAHASTRRIFGLQQLDGQAALFQFNSATKAGETGPHNCYIDHGRQFAILRPANLAACRRAKARYRPRLNSSPSTYLVLFNGNIGREGLSARH